MYFGNYVVVLILIFGWLSLMISKNLSITCQRLWLVVQFQPIILSLMRTISSQSKLYSHISLFTSYAQSISFVLNKDRLVMRFVQFVIKFYVLGFLPALASSDAGAERYARVWSYIDQTIADLLPSTTSIHWTYGLNLPPMEVYHPPTLPQAQYPADQHFLTIGLHQEVWCVHYADRIPMQ